MMIKNKKAWIRIVEAFVAILLIMGVLLIVMDKGYFKREDISAEIYKIEISILREIQLDNELREEILSANPPVEWDDSDFPLETKNKIISRLPNYLDCEAKICTINETCVFDKVFDKDIYAQSVSIIAGLIEYNPRQLKLFCWIK